MAKDVTDILGYANGRKACADHCKAAVPDGVTIRDSMGRVQKSTGIPERDVYRLVMRSHLPAAEEFEEWVVGTVLPSIRKTGGYIAGEERLASGEESEAEFLARAFDVLRRTDLKRGSPRPPSRPRHHARQRCGARRPRANTTDNHCRSRPPALCDPHVLMNGHLTDVAGGMDGALPAARIERFRPSLRSPLAPGDRESHRRRAPA